MTTDTEPRGPLGQTEADKPAMTTLYEAVRYALDRIQRDPDLRHHLLGTEAFARLCAAESMASGRSYVDILNFRWEDLQPEHDRREPELVALRRQFEDVVSQRRDEAQPAREDRELAAAAARLQLADIRRIINEEFRWHGAATGMTADELARRILDTFNAGGA